jgi:hypothetical protein
MTSAPEVHQHPHEHLPEPSGSGSVVLDIGGTVGAAAVYVPESLDGREIEIRAVGSPWAGQHVAVRERTLADGSVWAALFPSLPEGAYEIRVRHGAAGEPTTLVDVAGARVATVHWQG